MAKAVSDAAVHLTRKGLADKSAPVIVRFIARVAARFSIVVSEKAVAQAVPVVGALGGALINTLFIGHFQDIGRAHFTIRRLERRHGPETVRRIYGEV
jgi:dihydroxyacid dehydratase/phosphogluconate dehydratase